MGIGAGELLLILLVALLIFGPSKLADIGKGLGEGLKNFKKGMDEEAHKPKPNAGQAAKAPDPAQAAVAPPASGQPGAPSDAPSDPESGQTPPATS